MKAKTLEEEALDLKLAVEFTNDEIVEAKALLLAKGFDEREIAEAVVGIGIEPGGTS